MTDERRCYFGTRRCAGPVRPYVMGGRTVRLGCDFHCAGVYPRAEDARPSTSPSPGDVPGGGAKGRRGPPALPRPR